MAPPPPFLRNACLPSTAVSPEPAYIGQGDIENWPGGGPATAQGKTAAVADDDGEVPLIVEYRLRLLQVRVPPCTLDLRGCNSATSMVLAPPPQNTARPPNTPHKHLACDTLAHVQACITNIEFPQLCGVPQGLRQYYRQRHAEGSLSNNAYKVNNKLLKGRCGPLAAVCSCFTRGPGGPCTEAIPSHAHLASTSRAPNLGPQALSFIADHSIHEPDKPLELWHLAQQELGAGFWLQVSSYFNWFQVLGLLLECWVDWSASGHVF